MPDHAMTLESKATRTAFGALVGISRQAVADLVLRGVLAEGETLGQWLHAYCAHLREQAAGRSTGNAELNLAEERALLAREQRVRIEMENGVRKGELAPKELLVAVLTDGVRQMVSILETVPGKLRLRLGKDASTRVLVLVKEEIDRARNVIADIKIGGGTP